MESKPLKNKWSLIFNETCIFKCYTRPKQCTKIPKFFACNISQSYLIHFKEVYSKITSFK